MGTIRILSEALRNQIAAGEVVERPASVVKELIENALDAQATEISLLLKKGGMEEIRVQDNGVGMDEEDAIMALKRHATSKISSSDDLFALLSFGFRGEALASIASISECILITRTRDNNYGIRIDATTGEKQEVSAPEGTEVIVKSLFYNVPARRKFVKSERTENAHVAEMVEHFALANPHVSFRLRFDERAVLDVGQHDSEQKLYERAKALFGADFAAQLFPVHYMGDEMKIHGFVSHPHVQRRNRKNQRFFVNKRPIQDRIIGGALARAYESLVPKGLYPDALLFLEISPELVDVNVHPRKSEVKFREEREIFSKVLRAVQEALQRKPEQNESLRTTNAQRIEWKLSASAPVPKSNSNNFFVHKKSTGNIAQQKDFALPSLFASDGENEERTQGSDIPKNYTIIGQVRKSFILLECDKEICIVDQHAAHERVRYEKLMSDLRHKKAASQKLLAPQVIELSLSEKETLEAHRDIFESLGFDIQDFSEQEIAIFAVPAGTEKVDFERNIRHLLDDLESHTPEQGRAVQTPAERISTFAACRGAIKFGDTLSLKEMEGLIADLFACETPYACAHGRPVWTRISYAEMKNECGR